MRQLRFLSILFASLTSLAGDLQPCKVIRVVDGDTFECRLDDQNVTVRLLGIDAPESVHPTTPTEPGGPEASAFLTNLIEGKLVYVEASENAMVPTDRFGRSLCYAYLDPLRVDCVNELMVKDGHARSYREYSCALTPKLDELEATAKARSVGIWSAGANAITNINNRALPSVTWPPSDGDTPLHVRLSTIAAAADRELRAHRFSYKEDKALRRLRSDADELSAKAEWYAVKKKKMPRIVTARCDVITNAVNYPTTTITPVEITELQAHRPNLTHNDAAWAIHIVPAALRYQEKVDEWVKQERNR